MRAIFGGEGGEGGKEGRSWPSASPSGRPPSGVCASSSSSKTSASPARTAVGSGDDEGGASGGWSEWNCTSPLLLQEADLVPLLGPHTVMVRARDSVGNQDDSPAQAVWEVQCRSGQVGIRHCKDS